MENTTNYLIVPGIGNSDKNHGKINIFRETMFLSTWILSYNVTRLINQHQANSGKSIMTPLKLIYLANILVAAWISITSLFFPKLAQQTVFSNAFAYSEAIRLVGALWGAIFLLSILGLFYPQQMSLVLLFQLIYKSSWLLVAALPAVLHHTTYPKGMALFFVIWVVVLPFVIPWKELFGS